MTSLLHISLLKVIASPCCSHSSSVRKTPETLVVFSTSAPPGTVPGCRMCMSWADKPSSVGLCLAAGRRTILFRVHQRLGNQLLQQFPSARQHFERDQHSELRALQAGRQSDHV